MPPMRTVSPLDLRVARDTEIAIRGAAPAGVRATTIAAGQLAAHNTFEQPRAVEPRETSAGPIAGGTFVHRFPPASVTRLTITLT
jgi:alpha-L-arabinofuranosidase